MKSINKIWTDFKNSYRILKTDLPKSFIKKEDYVQLCDL